MAHSIIPPSWLAMIALGFACTSLISAQVPEPILVLKGHTAPVYAVALTSDGKIAATGSFDRSIKLWNAQSGTEIRTLAGKNAHKNQILALDFAPDGRTLASGGSDNQVKLWAVPAAEPVASFPLPDPARAVAISPDGKTVAVGTADGQILLLPPEGMPTTKLNGSAPGVNALAFSPNGQWLISLGDDRIVRYWEPKQAEPLRASVGVSLANLSGLGVTGNGGVITMSTAGELKYWLGQPPNLPGKAIPAFPAAITAIAQSSDGNTIITGLADQQVQVSRWNDGQVARKFEKLPAAVTCVAVAGNGDAFAAGLANGQLLIWNNDGKLRATVPAHDGPITTVEFVTATQLASASMDGTLKVWSIPTAGFKPTDPPVKPQREYTTPPKSLTAIHPGSGRFVTVDDSQTVKLGDPDPAKPARPLGTLSAPRPAVAFSRDGNAVAAAAGKQVKIWTINDGKETPLPELPSVVASVNFSPDRSKLLAGLDDGTAWVIDLGTSLPLQFLPSAGKVSAVLFHPNQPIVLTVGTDHLIARHPLLVQRQVLDPDLIGVAFTLNSNGSQAFTAGKSGEVTAWNTGNGNKEKTYPVSGPVTAIAVSKNNQLVAVAHGAEAKITVFQANSAQVVGEFLSGGAVSELLFHPTQPAVLGRRGDQRLIAWNLLFEANQPVPPEFGRAFQEFPHPGPVTGMAMTTDGERLVTVAADRQIRVWAFAPDQPLKSLNHPNLVDAVAFDPSGNQVATGCHDGQLRIWDVVKGQQVKAITAHTQPQPSPIYTVAWTPDGKQLITGSYDRSIKIWDVGSGNLVREMKPAVDRFPPEPAVGQTAPAILGSLGGAWLNAPPALGHRDQVFTVALDGPRQRLASGSSDRTLILWNFPAGEPIQPFANPSLPPPVLGLVPAAHPGFINAFRFTPDGQRLISVGPAPHAQGYLGVWSVNDGRLIAGTELPHGPVHSLAVRPDGAAILLGFGYRSRMQTECDAVLFPLPK